MVEINIAYEGELSCRAEHGPSGAYIVTDAPKDNHGKGESFSPTDLVATALGCCMLTIMGIVANKMRIDIKGTKVKVVKEMVVEPIRRIGKLSVDIHVPYSFEDITKEKLKTAALTCPVHKSLHPDIETPINFTWGDK